MQGIGHLLASSLLVASLLSVLAQNKGTSANSQHSNSSQRETAFQASPSETTSSSSSSSGGGGGKNAADRAHAETAAAAPAQAVANAPTNSFAQQAYYSHPHLANAAQGGFAYPTLLTSYAYKLPLREIWPRPPQSDRHSVSSALSQARANQPVEEAHSENENSKAGKQDKASAFHEHKRSPHALRRVKRGGYNAPYFVGKRSLEESEDLEQGELQKRDASDSFEDDEGARIDGEEEEEGEEREAGPETSEEFLDIPEGGSDRVEVETRAAPYFVGRRGVPMYVGKRKLTPLFVGRRRAPYFVGKRPRPMFVGRAAPMFVGKRQTPLYVGKRQSPMFVGKRQAPMFVGKRPSPMFVGKRPSPMFVGKRPSPMFVGKRPSPMFVGKRPSPMFVGKRPSPMFVGKRPSPMFVGKRPSPMFVGKRQSPMFVGKRQRPLYVGKRKEEGLDELLAALHTLQRARHYRRLIQTDKRHNAPFFVGRRSSASPQDSASEKTPEDRNDFFR